MIHKEQFDKLLPLACEWAKRQEEIILENGVSLSNDQKIDAYLIGVKEIQKARLLKVETIPTPSISELKSAVQITGLFTENTSGVAFRYGIYIKADSWNRRRLVVHELTHTMQYERFGGFKPFLEQYLDECINIGYPYGTLEQEAIRMEKQICT